MDLFDQEDETMEDEGGGLLDLTREERRLVTQPYDLSLATLIDDVARSRLLLNIDYQRKYVWDRSKGSRLIESFLLNVPVPVCYFAENKDGTYEVIDGLQRIQTIYDFLCNRFPIRGVTVLNELDGLHFWEMPEKDQRRLQNRTIRCIVITEDSHPDIKFDVFERLNTGSAKLVHQELRNCIYRGRFNDFLKETAGKEYFADIVGGIRKGRMDKEECALRFFALYHHLENYRPPLRQLLNNYMRTHSNVTPSEEEIEVFRNTCLSVGEIFGRTAFQLESKSKKSGSFNKALFDALMLPLAFADQEAAVNKAEEVRVLRSELLQNERFAAAIGRATADKSRMRTRTNAFAEGLRNMGIKCDLPQIPEK